MKAIALATLFCLVLCSCGGGSVAPTQPSLTASRPLNSSTVVFFGDSITSHWDLSIHFPGKPYLNRGIGGNTSFAMQARFPTDVLSANPGVVVILGGTNDVANGLDDVSIEQNLTASYSQATAANIRIVVGTIPPMRSAQATNNPQIVRLNQWIRSNSLAQGFQVADYYSVLVDSNGELNAGYAELLTDGVTLDSIHVNEAGYLVMDPIVAKALSSIK